MITVIIVLIVLFCAYRVAQELIHYYNAVKDYREFLWEFKAISSLLYDALTDGVGKYELTDTIYSKKIVTFTQPIIEKDLYKGNATFTIGNKQMIIEAKFYYNGQDYWKLYLRFTYWIGLPFKLRVGSPFDEVYLKDFKLS